MRRPGVPARRLRHLALALGALAAFGGSAHAAAAAAGHCGKNGVICKSVRVPLDPSGKVPGTITLHVEELSAGFSPRGVMFMLAGGPGQPSAEAFDLGSDQLLWEALFPGYTLVAFDYRGTGKSDPISCPGIGITGTPSAARVAACARRLGSKASFYRTADNAYDIEAVRETLKFDRIGLWGVSYGTEVALEYARTYPANVDRLLLDSVVPPGRYDPFAATVLRSLPAKLKTFCGGGACRAATKDYPGEVVALANALDRKPLRGSVLQANGSRKTETLGAVDFVGLVVDTDLDPGLAAEMPAAVHAAREGRPLPLLRLQGLASHEENLGLSPAVYLATECEDGPFPWTTSTPLSQRPALLKSALASLPAGALGGFGKWAAALGNAESCLDWPVSTDATAALHPYPNVPTLVLSGDDDIRTPTAQARSVIAKLANAKLLRVTNVGHSVLTNALSACVIDAEVRWLTKSSVAKSCPSPRLIRPVPSLPAGTSGATSGRDGEAAVVETTLDEAEADWILGLTESGNVTGSGPSVTVPGLTAGKLVARGTTFTLSGYGLAGGITLSGQITASAALGSGFHFAGTVVVKQGKKTAGKLTIDGGSLHGTLGGKPFSGG